MAKARYKKWLEKDGLNLIEGWKRNGLTDEQIAHNMGIAPRTLEYWKRDHVQIMQALKIGRESANLLVERELFHKAAAGNTTAMIFWLKNNWRDKYNDSQLSPEERELAKARIAKIKADTRISNARAENLENGGQDVTEAVGDFIELLKKGVDQDHDENTHKSGADK